MKLYSNIGRKIRRVAVALFIVLGLVFIGVGIALMVIANDIDEPLFFIGLGCILLGPFISLVLSWFLYGFGQLVEDAHKIDSKVGDLGAGAAAGKSPAQTSKKFDDLPEL